MAGDWIKWSKGLARKPEVMQIAHRLELSRHAAAGLLMEVWEWADDNVMIDESLSGFDPDKCPGSVRLGDQSKQLFDATFAVSGLADALAAVGWIELRSGSVTFPNFSRHNGKSAKARALDSSRKRAERDGRLKPVRNLSGSEQDKNRTRAEKRREEDKEPPNPPQPGGTGESPPIVLIPPPKADPPAKAKTPRKKADPPTHAHGIAIARWCAAWEAKYPLDKKYPFDGSRDAQRVKYFLDQCEQDQTRLDQIFARYLADDSPYHGAELRHPLERLKRNFTRWYASGKPTTAPAGQFKNARERDQDYLIDQTRNFLNPPMPDQEALT